MTEVRNSEVTAYKMKVTWMHVYLNNNNNNKFQKNKKIIINPKTIIIIIIISTNNWESANVKVQ
jgi:hypothetical protein